MSVQILFVIITSLVLLVILSLFIAKAGLQLQYLRIKAGKSPGKVLDFMRFDFSNETERRLRWQAFLIFPMFYAIVPDEKDNRLNELKLKVKRIHIGIYLSLTVLIVLGIYSEKVFPS